MLLSLVLSGGLPLLSADHPGEEEAEAMALEARKAMAGHMNTLRGLGPAGGLKPEESLAAARALWLERVKPWMEGEARKYRELAGKESGLHADFQERLARRMDSRIGTVERGLAGIEKALAEGKGPRELDESAREIIWALSHQPEGFEAPPADYTWEDWAVALGIGFGHLGLVLLIAFYLRRRYRTALKSKPGGS